MIWRCEEGEEMEASSSFLCLCKRKKKFVKTLQKIFDLSY